MRKLCWHSKAVLTIAALSMVACGSSSGRAPDSGGDAGSSATPPCNPQFHNEGCFESKRLKCQPDGTWTEIAVCPADAPCTEMPDPAAPGTDKLVTTCFQAPTDVGVSDAGRVGDHGDVVPVDEHDAGVDDVAAAVEEDPIWQEPDDAFEPDDTGPEVVSGPTCLSTPYVPTQEEKAYFGKGCTEKSDVDFLQSIALDPGEDAAMRKLLLDCLLGIDGGCSGKGDSTPEGKKKIEQCTASCVLTHGDKGITESCAGCFAIHGTCGFLKCLGSCAADTGSPACKECLACKCDPVFSACLQPSVN